MVQPRFPLAIAGLPLEGAFETFADAMEAVAARFPDHEACVDSTRRLSFADWHREADSLAGALHARGVEAGDVVLIALDPSAEFALACAAALLLGAVASALDTSLSPSELGAVVERSAARVLITQNETAPLADALLVIPRAALAALCREQPLGARRPRGRGGDPAIIAWTFDAAGKPKGAWFDHRNLEAAILTASPVAAAFDRRLVSMPLAHASYLTKLWEQLAFVMTHVFPPTPWHACDVLQLVADEGITSFSAAPAHWSELMAHPRLATMALPQLRIAASTMEPIPARLAEAITWKLACPLIARHGSAELPSITATVPGDDPHTLSLTAGLPQLGVELRLVDGGGVPVAEGQVGIVQVRSPAAMRGYWRDEAATRTAFTSDGWLDSGKPGRIDEDGNLVPITPQGPLSASPIDKRLHARIRFKHTYTGPASWLN